MGAMSAQRSHNEAKQAIATEGLGSTQGQARELFSDRSTTAKTRLMSFNKTQSRVVTDLLTGHNTLRRHLHWMGVTNSPLCRRCGANDETSTHILCECEALTSLRHTHLGSSFLDPEDIKSFLSVEAITNFTEGTGFPWTGNGTKDPFLRPGCIGTVRARTQLPINQSPPKRCTITVLYLRVSCC